MMPGDDVQLDGHGPRQSAATWTASDRGAGRSRAGLHRPLRDQSRLQRRGRPQCDHRGRRRHADGAARDWRPGSEGSTRGGASYGNVPLIGQAQTYYRITTRIDGPRNTVRYVQALVVI